MLKIKNNLNILVILITFTIAFSVQDASAKIIQLNDVRGQDTCKEIAKLFNTKVASLDVVGDRNHTVVINYFAGFANCDDGRGEFFVGSNWSYKAKRIFHKSNIVWGDWRKGTASTPIADIRGDVQYTLFLDSNVDAWNVLLGSVNVPFNLVLERANLYFNNSTLSLPNSYRGDVDIRHSKLELVNSTINANKFWINNNSCSSACPSTINSTNSLIEAHTAILFQSVSLNFYGDNNRINYKGVSNINNFIFSFANINLLDTSSKLLLSSASGSVFFLNDVNINIALNPSHVNAEYSRIKVANNGKIIFVAAPPFGTSSKLTLSNVKDLPNGRYLLLEGVDNKSISLASFGSLWLGENDLASTKSVAYGQVLVNKNGLPNLFRYAVKTIGNNLYFDVCNYNGYNITDLDVEKNSTNGGYLNSYSNVKYAFGNNIDICGNAVSAKMIFGSKDANYIYSGEQYVRFNSSSVKYLGKDANSKSSSTPFATASFNFNYNSSSLDFINIYINNNNNKFLVQQNSDVSLLNSKVAFNSFELKESQLVSSNSNIVGSVIATNSFVVFDNNSALIGSLSLSSAAVYFNNSIIKAPSGNLIASNNSNINLANLSNKELHVNIKHLSLDTNSSLNVKQGYAFLETASTSNFSKSSINIDQGELVFFNTGQSLYAISSLNIFGLNALQDISITEKSEIRLVNQSKLKLKTIESSGSTISLYSSSTIDSNLNLFNSTLFLRDKSVIKGNVKFYGSSISLQSSIIDGTLASNNTLSTLKSTINLTDSEVWGGSSSQYGVDVSNTTINLLSGINSARNSWKITNSILNVNSGTTLSGTVNAVDSSIVFSANSSFDERFVIVATNTLISLNNGVLRTSGFDLNKSTIAGSVALGRGNVSLKDSNINGSVALSLGSVSLKDSNINGAVNLVGTHIHSNKLSLFGINKIGASGVDNKINTFSIDGLNDSSRLTVEGNLTLTNSRINIFLSNTNVSQSKLSVLGSLVLGSGNRLDVVGLLSDNIDYALISASNWKLGSLGGANVVSYEGIKPNLEVFYYDNIGFSYDVNLVNNVLQIGKRTNGVIDSGSVLCSDDTYAGLNVRFDKDDGSVVVAPQKNYIFGTFLLNCPGISSSTIKINGSDSLVYNKNTIKFENAIVTYFGNNNSIEFNSASAKLEYVGGALSYSIISLYNKASISTTNTIVTLNLTKLKSETFSVNGGSLNVRNSTIEADFNSNNTFSIFQKANINGSFNISANTTVKDSEKLIFYELNNMGAIGANNSLSGVSLNGLIGANRLEVLGNLTLTNAKINISLDNTNVAQAKLSVLGSLVLGTGNKVNVYGLLSDNIDYALISASNWKLGSLGGANVVSYEGIKPNLEVFYYDNIGFSYDVNLVNNVLQIVKRATGVIDSGSVLCSDDTYAGLNVQFISTSGLSVEAPNGNYVFGSNISSCAVTTSTIKINGSVRQDYANNTIRFKDGAKVSYIGNSNSTLFATSSAKYDYTNGTLTYTNIYVNNESTIQAQGTTVLLNNARLDSTGFILTGGSLSLNQSTINSTVNINTATVSLDNAILGDTLTTVSSNVGLKSSSFLKDVNIVGGSLTTSSSINLNGILTTTNSNISLKDSSSVNGAVNLSGSNTNTISVLGINSIGMVNSNNSITGMSIVGLNNINRLIINGNLTLSNARINIDLDNTNVAEARLRILGSLVLGTGNKVNVSGVLSDNVNYALISATNWKLGSLGGSNVSSLNDLSGYLDVNVNPSVDNFLTLSASGLLSITKIVNQINNNGSVLCNNRYAGLDVSFNPVDNGSLIVETSDNYLFGSNILNCNAIQNPTIKINGSDKVVSNNTIKFNNSAVDYIGKSKDILFQTASANLVYNQGVLSFASINIENKGNIIVNNANVSLTNSKLSTNSFVLNKGTLNFIDSTTNNIDANNVEVLLNGVNIVDDLKANNSNLAIDNTLSGNSFIVNASLVNFNDALLSYKAIDIKDKSNVSVSGNTNLLSNTLIDGSALNINKNNTLLIGKDEQSNNLILKNANINIDLNNTSLLSTRLKVLGGLILDTGNTINVSGDLRYGYDYSLIDANYWATTTGQVINNESDYKDYLKLDISKLNNNSLVKSKFDGKVLSISSLVVCNDYQLGLNIYTQSSKDVNIAGGNYLFGTVDSFDLCNPKPNLITATISINDDVNASVSNVVNFNNSNIIFKSTDKVSQTFEIASANYVFNGGNFMSDSIYIAPSLSNANWLFTNNNKSLIEDTDLVLKTISFNDVNESVIKNSNITADKLNLVASNLYTENTTLQIKELNLESGSYLSITSNQTQMDLNSSLKIDNSSLSLSNNINQIQVYSLEIKNAKIKLTLDPITNLFTSKINALDNIILGLGNIIDIDNSKDLNLSNNYRILSANIFLTRDNVGNESIVASNQTQKELGDFLQIRVGASQNLSYSVVQDPFDAFIIALDGVDNSGMDITFAKSDSLSIFLESTNNMIANTKLQEIVLANDRRYLTIEKSLQVAKYNLSTSVQNSIQSRLFNRSSSFVSTNSKVNKTLAKSVSNSQIKLPRSSSNDIDLYADFYAINGLNTGSREYNLNTVNLLIGGDKALVLNKNNKALLGGYINYNQGSFSAKTDDLVGNNKGQNAILKSYSVGFYGLYNYNSLVFNAISGYSKTETSVNVDILPDDEMDSIISNLDEEKKVLNSNILNSSLSVGYNIKLLGDKVVVKPLLGVEHNFVSAYDTKLGTNNLESLNIVRSFAGLSITSNLTQKLDFVLEGKTSYSLLKDKVVEYKDIKVATSVYGFHGGAGLIYKLGSKASISIQNNFHKEGLYISNSLNFGIKTQF